MMQFSKKTQTTKTLIIDANFLTRKGFKALFEAMPDYEVTREAEELLQVHYLLKTKQPYLIVVHLNTPNSIDIIRTIKQNNAQHQIIVFANEVEDHEFNQLLAMNIDGLLMKDGKENELVECLRKLQQGKTFLSRTCQKNSTATHNKPTNELHSLNRLEVKILQMIAEKKTTNEIASVLFKSPKTIENRRYQMCRKLNLNGHNSLLIYALEHKQTLVAMY
ncbi:response regulator transcription factor [uncultured Microscilla sp.]|uniref:response regulator n=1 Tax=uncultured Microscilla sp. TaxID=432653 RepID=UPI002636ECBF|nr:response regulator transcription factor [uncultured Microscilla sp.]